MSFFTTLVTAPFAWVMRLFYSLTGSYGIALLLFTLMVKLIMLPFQMKSKKSMVRMGRLTGKQQELQKKYANNQAKYQEELQKLYTEAGVNPMSGCLWSFLPLVILIPLYTIIRMPLTAFMRMGEDVVASVRELATSLGYVAEMIGERLSTYEEIALAKFVSDHWADFEGKFEGLTHVNFSFLGLDLTTWPKNAFSNFEWSWACIGLILIPILSGVLSWLLSKVTSSSNGQSEQGSMKGMMIMMPLLSVYIGFVMPTALGLYWIYNSLFSIIQEATLGKFFNQKIQAEEEERERKREAARQLRMEEAKRQAAEQRENPAPKQKKKPQEKDPAEKKISTSEAGRVGGRPYARGRSYVENRYDEQ